MKKKLLFSVLLTFISVSFLFAQDNKLNGQWKGKIMDQYDITNEFVVKGDSLTGKSIHYDGSSSDITNGKINGDSLSYDVSYNGETIHIKGKLSGDVLSVVFNYQGNDLSADLKKTEAEAKQ